MDDVIILKAASLERCIKRIHDDFDHEFNENLTKQDAVILNLQGSCQLCIDMAAHVVRVQRLGIPQMTTELFDLLAENQIIDDDLRESLVRMVGFRNIAIHEYQSINLDIVKSIINQKSKGPKILQQYFTPAVTSIG